MSKKEWKKLILQIARGSLSQKEEIQTAWNYMAKNWDDLSETPHGRFLRECVGPVPDLTLKGIYRREVLKA